MKKLNENILAKYFAQPCKISFNKPYLSFKSAAFTKTYPLTLVRSLVLQLHFSSISHKILMYLKVSFDMSVLQQ